MYFVDDQAALRHAIKSTHFVDDQAGLRHCEERSVRRSNPSFDFLLLFSFMSYITHVTALKSNVQAWVASSQTALLAMTRPHRSSTKCVTRIVMTGRMAHQ